MRYDVDRVNDCIVKAGLPGRVTSPQHSAIVDGIGRISDTGFAIHRIEQQLKLPEVRGMQCGARITRIEHTLGV